MRNKQSAIGPARAFLPAVMVGAKGPNRGKTKPKTTTIRGKHGVTISWTEPDGSEASIRPKTLPLAEVHRLYLRGIPKKTLYRYAREELLPAFKSGKQWVVETDHLDELVAWITSNWKKR